MSSPARRIFLRPERVLAIALLISSAAFAPTAFAQGTAIPPGDDKACLECHTESMAEGMRAVSAATLKKSLHKDLACQDCHASITAEPHTPAMLKEKATCGSCHPDEESALAGSVHARKDKVAGDHPTCVSCHGKGDPHSLTLVKASSASDKARNCMSCHSDAARMARYGVDPDAAKSYADSFHGKALLAYGDTKSAHCASCHKAHDVLSPDSPQAPTNRANAAKTCGQRGCHPGAKINFAMSGANHLTLKEKSSVFLRGEALFFEVLTVGTMVLLLAGVALDLRRKVLGRGAQPRAGRATGVLISASFLAMVLALVFSYLGRSGIWFAVEGLALMLLAFIWYLVRGPKRPVAGGQPRYERMTFAMQWQHIMLAVSFILLCLTGLPLRFAHTEWLQGVQSLFGGFQGARVVHRVAAVVMIISWVWHTIYLFVLWKRQGWSVRSWSMVPNMKDVRDFIQVSRYYLGLSSEEPKYDRFQFREKFDYFAVYWGMPIMVLSGLVLWFPIYFGNRLPEIGVSAAYIAHSDEAILAFLAIVMWHLYNVHFNPDAFPMSNAWLTRTKTEEEMAREHPLELERIKKKG
jgi:cytochrome b subunit of formate dehydrogenase